MTWTPRTPFLLAQGEWDDDGRWDDGYPWLDEPPWAEEPDAVPAWTPRAATTTTWTEAD